MKRILCLLITAGVVFAQSHSSPSTGASAGTVTGVSSGNAAPLFNAAFSGSATPSLAFTLLNFTAHTWYGNNTSGTAVPGAQQPACADLSNSAASCSTDATNASNISSGVLNAARLPATAGLTGNPLSQFASTTSAQLAGVLSDETGTGSAVFSASPALSGTPTAPTQTAGDGTTKIATDAFVANAITGLPATAVPQGLSTASAATSYTVTGADSGHTIVFSSASAVSILLPATPSTLTRETKFFSTGAGGFVFNPNGNTVLTASGAAADTSVSQYSMVTVEADPGTSTNYIMTVQPACYGVPLACLLPPALSSGLINGSPATIQSSDIAVASTIAPTFGIARITGAGTVTTITPYGTMNGLFGASGAGPVYFQTVNQVNFATGGNIANNFTSSAGQVVQCTYFFTQSQWVCSGLPTLSSLYINNNFSTDLICSQAADSTISNSVGALTCNNTSTDATTETSFSQAFQIPANFLTSGKTLTMDIPLSVWSSATTGAKFTIRLRYGNTPGGTSNGGNQLFLTLAGGITANFTNQSLLVRCVIQAASTTSLGTSCTMPNVAGWSTSANQIPQPVAVTSTTAKYITVDVTYLATGLVSATYVLGGTLSGTGVCTIPNTGFNQTSSATATFAVNAGVGGAITITARGVATTQPLVAPTTMTLTGVSCTGGATATGTATITSTVGGSPGNAVQQTGQVVMALN